MINLLLTVLFARTIKTTVSNANACAVLREAILILVRPASIA